MRTSPFGRLAPAVITALALPASLHAADAAPAANPDAAAALDRAISGLDAPPQAPAAPQRSNAPLLQIGTGGGPTIRLADISLGVMTAAGASTATDPQLADIQGGDHDPKRRGFTLQNVETSLFGAVDPYFNAEAHIVYKEEGVELEEAFGTTTQLPYALQLKFGKYFTEFGRTNPQHPHQWPWLDQPVVNTRIFGADGTRGVGARLAWLAPVPWFSEFYVGMQNADNETMVSFLGGDVEDPAAVTIGGRPIVARASTRSLADFLYAMRWVNNWEVGEETMLQIGLSSAFGPNLTGLKGRTVVIGGDLLVKWRERQRGYPNLIWQTEVVARRYHADEGFDSTLATTIPSDDLRDWGLTSQVLVGLMPRWTAGLRGDYATGSGDSYVVGTGAVPRSTDAFRDDRWRLSPLIAFNPSEFSKIRLQYDHDRLEHLPDHHVHSAWIGLEILIGAHPAHTY
jgi:hypothetical protein